MTTIEFRRLSLEEAEEVLADVWNCLEEYGIPSPQMAFVFAGETGVSFRLHFGEPLWARLIASRLSNGMVAGAGRAVIDGRNGGAIGRYLLVSRRAPPRAYRLS